MIWENQENKVEIEDLLTKMQESLSIILSVKMRDKQHNVKELCHI